MAVFDEDNHAARMDPTGVGDGAQRRDLDQNTSRLMGAARSAARTLDIESRALAALGDALATDLGQRLDAAVELLAAVKGRIIVTGMGKSGHIGQKTAATFSSTGSPAYFVHPSEASHGDLGMVTPEDAVLAFSWSGETVELTNILAFATSRRVPVVAVTSSDTSALARASTVVLCLPKAEEACPHKLAPTTSTTMQLAIGDALAIALLEVRGFTAHDFKIFHPGGSLGAQLRNVCDLMHSGAAMPLVAQGTPMGEALVLMTQKAFGGLGVVDGDGKLVGVVTDGDLRRHMGDGLLMSSVDDVMTRSPKTTGPDVLSTVALDQLNANRVTALFVVEDDGRPVGIVHVHDLIRAEPR